MPEPDDLSEIDTTPEEFDSMWAEGVPVETVGRSWIHDNTISSDPSLGIRLDTHCEFCTKRLRFGLCEECDQP